MIFRIQLWHGGGFLFTLGLLGLLIYFTARTIKDYLFHRTNQLIMLLEILIVLMSGILFSKYLYHFFGDYPGILIIPLFFITSVLYLFYSKSKDNKLITAVITYLLLSIPLFGLEFHKAPRQYIPTEWYNRYNVSNAISIDLHSGYEFKETEKLCTLAYDLKKSKHYLEAMVVFRKALSIEPNNTDVLFALSECYAITNQLERAVSIMDTVILLDSTFAPFYSNRGLMHYKLQENNLALNDFKKAIIIDSTHWLYYANIALVYYDDEDYGKACSAIQKAENLGMDISSHKYLIGIKKETCK